MTQELPNDYSKLSTETLTRIVEACLPKNGKVERSGGVFRVLKGKTVAFVANSLEDLARFMESAARTKPLVNQHQATHLFGRPCTVKFGARRGEFILEDESGNAVHLSWSQPSARWRGFDMNTGARLVYGPKKDFKLAWSEKERQQPALAAWLAY